MILSLPVLVPIALQIGVDPVHFGIIVVLNLVIGLVTPPVGLCLFIVCGISKVSLEDVSRAALPMIGICIFVLMLVTYFPELVLTIPNMFETKG
jgi:C4-dicarboxylate transporter DctM subunit